MKGSVRVSLFFAPKWAICLQQKYVTTQTTQQEADNRNTRGLLAKGRHTLCNEPLKSNAKPE